MQAKAAATYGEFHSPQGVGFRDFKSGGAFGAGKILGIEDAYILVSRKDQTVIAFDIKVARPDGDDIRIAVRLRMPPAPNGEREAALSLIEDLSAAELPADAILVYFAKPILPVDRSGGCPDHLIKFASGMAKRRFDNDLFGDEDCRPNPTSRTPARLFEPISPAALVLVSGEIGYPLLVPAISADDAAAVINEILTENDDAEIVRIGGSRR